eukprot:266832-Prymnesium_polylepis.1
MRGAPKPKKSTEPQKEGNLKVHPRKGTSTTKAAGAPQVQCVQSVAVAKNARSVQSVAKHTKCDIPGYPLLSAPRLTIAIIATLSLALCIRFTSRCCNFPLPAVFILLLPLLLSRSYR